MAESNLTLTYDDLVIAACMDAGYPTVEASRTTSQNDMLARVMEVGLRRAYFPGYVRLPSGRVLEPFAWSWMSDPISSATFWSTFAPTSGVTLTANGSSTLTATGTSVWYSTMVGKTITVYSNDGLNTVIGSGVVASVSGVSLVLASGTIAGGTYRWGMVADGDYRMDDIFGGLVGRVVFDELPNYADTVADAVIRDSRAACPGETGMPRMVSCVPERQSSGASPQRFLMRLFPAPSGIYVGRFRMTILPAALSSTLLYHAGGLPYSEVFRAAVRSAANSIVNGGSEPRIEEEFRESLAAAALHDLDNRPAYLGRLGDSMNPGNATTRNPTVIPSRYIGVN